MSEDPETQRQIDALAHDPRPLIVVDVDEVVLEFVRPFMAFLESRGHYLKTDTFRLNGNVISRETGKPAEDDTVARFLEDLFAEQDDWQHPVDGAAGALGQLGGEAAIVLLTAMPHRHHGIRRRLLDRHGIPYPLVTTEAAKGPAISAMRGDPSRLVAFVDDIPHNHLSVQKSVPDATLVHLMSYEPFKAVLPALPGEIFPARDWKHAQDHIATRLGLSG